MREGWRTLRLGDVCAIEKKKHDGSELPYVGLEDIESDTGRFLGVLQPKAVKSATFAFTDKHVLYGRLRPYLNKVLLPCFQGHCSSEIFPLKAGPEVNRGFLFYWLKQKAIVERINETSTGARMPRANVNQVLDFEFSFPLLTEQRRIIAILDEAFESIDTAIANTEKNLANAHELFESLLGSQFSPEASEGEQVSLENVLSEQPRNGWSPPAKNHSDAGTRVLTLSAVTGFHFRPEKFKFTSAATDPKRHYWVRNGDLLITRSNTPELVGHVAIAEALGEPTIYPDLIMRMAPDPARAITRYLYYQLRSPALRAEIKSRAHGANPTMKKISKQSVQTLPIFLPGLEAQHAVVTKLNEIQTALQSFEGVAKQKLFALAELKQSLLQKAFNGELTGSSATSDTIAEEADFA